MVAIEVLDPNEEELPCVGLIELQDSETGESRLIDSSHKKWRHYYRLERLKFDEVKRNNFHKFKIDHLKIRTDQPFEHKLTEFFKRRAVKQ